MVRVYISHSLSNPPLVRIKTVVNISRLEVRLTRAFSCWADSGGRIFLPFFEAAFCHRRCRRHLSGRSPVEKQETKKNLPTYRIIDILNGFPDNRGLRTYAPTHISAFSISLFENIPPSLLLLGSSTLRPRTHAHWSNGKEKQQICSSRTFLNRIDLLKRKEWVKNKNPVKKIEVRPLRGEKGTRRMLCPCKSFYWYTTSCVFQQMISFCSLLMCRVCALRVVWVPFDKIVDDCDLTMS